LLWFSGSCFQFGLDSRLCFFGFLFFLFGGRLDVFLARLFTTSFVIGLSLCRHGGKAEGSRPYQAE